MDWTLTDYLWLAGGLAAFVVCLPSVLGMLGCTRYAIRILESEKDWDRVGEEPYLFYRRQLDALGFEPLGVIEERCPFLGFHYIKRIRHRIFVHRDRGVYASIYRLFPGDEWRVMLSTLLTDGWLVQRSCLESLSTTAEKYDRRGTPTRIVREQLEVHLERLRLRWDKGDAIAPISLAALAGRLNEVIQPPARCWFREEAVFPFCVALFVLGGLAGLGWSVSAYRHLLVPGGLLVGSLVYRPFMHHLLRWMAHALRLEEVEKSPHQPRVAERSIVSTSVTGERGAAIEPERGARPTRGDFEPARPTR